ncbi:MAG TPA: CHASE4 domain-containing protein [Methanothrix sp.]|nr:CHASE4 domain-containing protein [Methanothrix sp.]HPJ83326.1 CHASE4 domain-containing protein [Methanothrix sp.]HPR65554.1 CHASE4 domain-containing protein [Methanothrix sp.]
MTLRKSTLIVNGAIILIMIVIISAFMWQLMISNLSELEEEAARHEVENTIFAIEEDLSSLNRIGGDWAPWNETRDFVLDGNEDYILANLGEETLANLCVNTMLFYNSSGEQFYGKAIDLASGKPVPVSPGLADLPKDNLLIAHTSPEDSVFGIIVLSEGLMMVSSNPILDNRGAGPICGSLIIGRPLDEVRLNELERLSGGVLKMEPIDAAKTPQRLRSLTSQDAPIIIETVDEDSMLAFKAIEDVYGKPTVLLEARLPRDIHHRGMMVIRSLELAVVLTCLTFGGVILLFLERFVLSPLDAITSSVEEISRTEGPDAVRVPKAGRGELANLAESINEMLDRLGNYNQKLRESEERFRTIFETAQDCIFIKDLEGRYVQANPAMERLLEMPASEIFGKRNEDFFPSETATKIHEADAEVLSGGAVANDVHIDLANGALATLHVVKVPLRDDLERVVGICGIARDITERKQSEIELQNRDMLLVASAVASNALLVEEDLDRVMVDALQFLAEAVVADRAYIFENHLEAGEVLMSQLYEWAKDDVEPQINNPQLQNLPYNPDYTGIYKILSKGKPYKDLVKDLPESERGILESQGIISILIVPIIVKGQLWGFVGFDDCHSERIWSKNDTTVLQSAAGSIGGAIIRSRTREDLVRARDELERRIGEVETKNAEMERFVYTVSHDLRSPLVTVQGFVGFLREDISEGDHEKVETDLEMIEDAVSKMDLLLKDTLELSRIGRVVNPPEEVSFGEIVSESLGRFSEDARSKGIEVLLPESWPAVRVDRLRIVEVLTNLIENSMKYMGDVIGPEIGIGWWREGDEIVFFVKDNGIGIEPDQREKVFELFYKLDPSTEGTGVGLAIVKRIIEVHGGRIWIESEEGMGTTVLFTLPAAEG